MDSYFDCKYLTLVGHVQSGKTNEEINYCYSSINHHNVPVIFLTRNIKADQLQLRDRFNTTPFDFNVKILSHLKMDQAVEVLNSNGIIIFLCNNHQLYRMRNILKKYTGKYNICIDEVDFSIKSSKCVSVNDILLTEIKKNANHILGATATPFAIFSNDRHLSKIKKLKPNSNYFGIETLQLNFVEPCIITSEADFPLCDMEAMDTIYESLLEKETAVLLHTVVKKKKLQYNIQKYISLNYPFTVITYNGDGIKVICNQRTSLSPMADNKSLNNYNQLVNKYFMISEGDNFVHLFQNYSISEVLQILKMDPEHNHTHISIIAGHLASRGISFVSTDYSLHLTDQYFYASKHTHGENLLQSLRILGCYKDNLPLTLWCSEKTWKSILQQNKIINNLVNGLDNRQDWMCKIKEIYIPNPKNPLTRPKLSNYSLNKNSDKEYFIKLNLESESESESEI